MKPIIFLFACLLNWNSATAFELSLQQTTALKKATQFGKYPAYILEGRVGNLDRTVVVVGESHRVNQDRYRYAKKLVKSFDFIGAEGIAVDKELTKALESAYYVASFFRKDTGSFPGPIKIAQDRFLKERQDMNRVEIEAVQILNEFDRYGKSINRPINVTDQPEGPHELFLQIGLRDGDTITNENVDRVIQDLRELLRQKGRLDLLNLETFNSAPESAKAYGATFVKLIHNLKMICTSGAGTLATFAVAKCLGEPYIANTALAAGGFVTLGFLYQSTKTSRQLKAVHHSMMNERNQIMVEQILKGFSDRPQAQTLLVLAGQDHLPGIVELLLGKDFIEAKTDFTL